MSTTLLFAVAIAFNLAQGLILPLTKSPIRRTIDVSTYTTGFQSSFGLYFTGDDWYGLMGRGTTTPELPSPTMTVLFPNTIDMCMGIDHTCVLDAKGGVYCSGLDSGPIATGEYGVSTDGIVLRKMPNKATQISCLFEHACVLMHNAQVRCWGVNALGQLGDGKTQAYRKTINPMKKPKGRGKIVQVATGGAHTCILTSVGAVLCLGGNTLGQLGTGRRFEKSTKLLDVAGKTGNQVKIALGYDHSCALSRTTGVSCWGSNGRGELGQSHEYLDNPMPMDVVGLESGVKNLFAGPANSCGLMENGAVMCWGDFSKQGLAFGASEYEYEYEGYGLHFHTPKPIVGLASDMVSEVALGEIHSCVRFDTSSIECFGSNAMGQLGVGYTSGDLPVSPMIAITPAPTSKGNMQCELKVGIKKKQCDAMLDEGCQVKFVGGRCKKETGGCRCATDCSFSCSRMCNSPQNKGFCVWKNNKCYRKYDTEPAEPMGKYCPIEYEDDGR